VSTHLSASEKSCLESTAAVLLRCAPNLAARGSSRTSSMRRPTL
jgi:hypothetical protein